MDLMPKVKDDRQIPVKPLVLAVNDIWGFVEVILLQSK